MLKKDNKYREYYGKVIIFGETARNEEGYTIVDSNRKKQIVEICEIENLTSDRVVTERYVLPLADATILNDSEGFVYCYNMSLDYLAETKHLAEVEKNIIIGQAYLYAGRENSLTSNKTSGLTLFMLGTLAILALVGMFT